VSERKDGKKERKERNRVRSTDKVQSFGFVIIIVDALYRACACACACACARKGVRRASDGGYFLGTDLFY
jgi:hypothetical protein